MTLYKPYNPNPGGNRVGDCTVRAICKATGKSWDEIHAWLFIVGHRLHDMQSANRVWGAYLRQLGFRRYLIDDSLENYTVEDFCRDHPSGTYILAIEGYVVCVEDGCYWDSWDSGQEIPIFYWTKEGSGADS